MKAIVAILLLAAVASAATLKDFRSWAKTHSKIYTRAEEPRRFAIFKENLAIAERLNLENHGARFGLSPFMDMTNAEFAKARTTKLLNQPKGIANMVVTPADNAAEADYTYMLPPVKDQASCGSCWAFSAVANAEGQTYMQGSKVVSLSEQQLVSCDKMDSACNGGSMVYADIYIIANGLESEKTYPYVSGTGQVPKCKKSLNPVAFFSSYEDFSRVSSDNTLMEHLDEYGPLSVGIEADKAIFQLYTSGVLDSSSCGTSLDHGVTLVGYGNDEETGKPYWLVRNSWGTTWGDQGYVKIVRGKNMCGINGMVSTIIA